MIKKKVSLKNKEERVDELSGKFIWWNKKKNDEKNDENKRGRPKKMTEDTIQKIKLCFAVGMTDREACYFCWIRESTLYAFQNENQDFLDEKDILKDTVSLQSRINIWKAIRKWSVADSWKRLEKKDSSFIPKMKFEWWLPVKMSEEDKSMYDKILKNNLWKKETKN